MKASDIYYGLSPKEVRRFAFTYALLAAKRFPTHGQDFKLLGAIGSQDS